MIMYTMEWWQEYNSGFVLTLVSLLMGSITVCVRACLKPKRTNVCYGCCVIERDAKDYESIGFESMNLIPPPTRYSEKDLV